MILIRDVQQLIKLHQHDFKSAYKLEGSSLLVMFEDDSCSSEGQSITASCSMNMRACSK